MSTRNIWASTQDFDVAYAQNALIKAHADISSKVRDLNFSLSLHLHPNFMYASREGSGKSVHMHRLARASTAR